MCEVFCSAPHAIRFSIRLSFFFFCSFILYEFVAEMPSFLCLRILPWRLFSTWAQKQLWIQNRRNEIWRNKEESERVRGRKRKKVCKHNFVHVHQRRKMSTLAEECEIELRRTFQHRENQTVCTNMGLHVNKIKENSIAFFFYTRGLLLLLLFHFNFRPGCICSVGFCVRTVAM